MIELRLYFETLYINGFCQVELHSLLFSGACILEHFIFYDPNVEYGGHIGLNAVFFLVHF